MSRKQVALTYMIGLNAAKTPAAYYDSIAALASRLCGGCTVQIAHGFWMQDGAEKKTTFSGQLERETCFQLELTCELEKQDHVMRMMEAGISGFTKHHNVETDWVHVKAVDFTGHHFSVTAHNSKLSNRAMQFAAMSPETKAAH